MRKFKYEIQGEKKYPILVEFKSKPMMTDRMKAIGEELLAWIMIVSATSAACLLIQFILNLK